MNVAFLRWLELPRWFQCPYSVLFLNMKSKIVAVLIYAACALSVVECLRHLSPGSSFSYWMTDAERYTQTAAVVSLPVFLFASIRAFFNLRFSYALALIAVLLPIPWLVHTELVQFKFANSWITLNLPDWIKGESYREMAEFKILASTVLMLALTYLSLRLLPQRWEVRGIPIQRRLWPVFVIPGLILAVWFFSAVTPYRVPGAVDGIGADLRILHIVKRGMRFEESVITTQRDRRFYISHGQRSLFQYHFSGAGKMGVLPKDVFDRISAFKENPVIGKLPSVPAGRLRDWNSEGWYVAGVGNTRLALTSENGVAPPKEVVDLFNEIAILPALNSTSTDARDICLGFCYDPPAAMGALFVNQRCSSGPEGLDRCE